MKAAVIIFPGSNCDRDLISVIDALWAEKGEVQPVWHADNQLPSVDLVALPGGFSYGDYLRSGAMAAHSPILKEVKAHADRGGLVLGICNGFQILTETGLLPGTLLQNSGLKFLCKDTTLRVENNSTPFTRGYDKGQRISIPIAHHEGNYFADADTHKALQDHDQIAFRYCDDTGALNDNANPNGSLDHIAGVFNKNKNVLGLMPHPERHADAATGGEDGKALFTGLLAA
jgi:phosphoribosylformylglycinamidine synthase